ncbi:MAG: murein biosynthesis integral membrane protein MurJ [Candidatus Woykebacteria bacterium RBG_16_43_9]|uniref:Probable lipid II flippase MurJ n=1 Tax=Candidatus Woykebacteria bacterium RBG_16_43_9 TaxID=1802596 RepID=A0A1G1WCS2_9BACT|nr:MAG: murein biosynthesis integral membrane protein MurJ [Candidatus Woykebacteria bacterium RBG_16_43_9]
MVRQFFTNSARLLFRRQSTIISAATIMMVLVLASRILGLVRNRFLTHFFPLEDLDAYTVAFIAPDFVADLLIVGILSVAFIPVFTTYINKNDEKEGWKVASSVLNMSLIFYTAIAAIIFIFADQINKFLAPGFSASTLEITTNLTRIIVFGQVLLIIGSFFTSVLQSFHRFIIPALAPVLYNLGIIFGILWLRPYLGLMGVAWGVVLGAFFHLLIQYFVARKFGFKYKFEFRLRDPGVKKIINLSLPRTAAIAFAKSEWLVSVFLASLLIKGSTATLRFAGDIQNLPVGLFGVTFAMAALPTLSAEWANRRGEDFKATFLATLHQVLYLTVPLSVLFMVLRIPVVRIMYGSGFFGWDATVATAVTMSYFAIGIFAQSGFLLLIRAFYSLHDAATPLKVALASLAFHVIVSSVFIFWLAPKVFTPTSLLALSASLTGIFSFGILLYLLDRKTGGFDRRKLFLPAAKIFFSAALMGILLYLPLHIKLRGAYIIDHIIDTTRVFNLLVLTGLAFIFGIAIYVWFTWWLKSEELRSFTRLLPDLRRLQKFLDVQEKIDSGTPK